MSKTTTSLNQFFKAQTLRWAVVGLLLTLLVAVPSILYSAKVSSERQLLVTAKTSARAFRPMIVEDGNIRDAQLKMKKALELKPGESAVVRGPDLKAIYPLEESDNIVGCRKPDRFCWNSGFNKVTLLYPIYFDDQKKESLFGYLELSMKPTIDISILSLLAFLLIITFIIQAIGLSSALSRCARLLTNHLGRWATHLQTAPEKNAQDSSVVPFSELQPMKFAVDGLHIEIEKLREKTAKDAKSQAHLALLREISHDLKTPHSLLAKYFALHLDTVRTTGKIDDAETGRVENTLKRMGELLKQVRALPTGVGNVSNLPTPSCDLVRESDIILEDLRRDPDIAEKKITIESRIEMKSADAKILKIAFYRILENFIRNAVEAGSDKITVSLKHLEGRPCLVVKDNGCGIAPELQKKIFEFDFTTKLTRGTGLGLGIIDQICKDFGAELRLISTVGIGSEFMILFQSAEGQIPLTAVQEVANVQI